ncbi:MAG: hypothetical protein ACLVDB_05325 [Anaeromassilibacillus sp.]
MVNGEVEYSATYGSSVRPRAPLCATLPASSITCPAKTTRSRCALISHVTKGGASSGHADTAPVSLDEKITTDEWEIDHTGGQIQSMKTLIDGEMYTIPMRTDDRGGFIWKYNGRQIAMTSGDPAEDGITYTGRSRSSNET